MVQEDRVEGKLVKVIPFVGLILLYIQMPQVLIAIFAIIIAIGGIALWIARKLDARDRKRAELQQKISMSI
jgi:predicted small integral membrane protein